MAAEIWKRLVGGVVSSSVGEPAWGFNSFRSANCEVSVKEIGVCSVQAYLSTAMC